MKSISPLVPFVYVLLLLPGLCAVNADDTMLWQNLFDGQTLTGWVQRGGTASYTVQDGCIVGTTAPNTPNSFLCTEKNYSNFILELDFQIDPQLNSGVQIRSQSLPSYQNGRVHGYQVEIDPSDRAWSGGIYDESRRGWLNDLKQNELARKAYKANQWNHLHIEAFGSSIRTWLNGIPAADLIDSLTPSGFIALQVHSSNNPTPLSVRWRNIRFCEITDPSYTSTYGLPGSRIKFGLVTYLWAKDWDLPTLLAHCQKAGIAGVELRTTHKHGVEPELTAQQRQDVKKLFADHTITLVGIGSNENFDNPDSVKLQESIERTKQFILLSRDVGGTGVKVKPNDFHEGIPHEQTIRQIGEALNLLGEFGQPYQQQIRLEAHGQCAQLPTIKAIMDIATHPNVAICWNSNPQDMEGEGLAANFNLIQSRLGDTIHVRPLNDDHYPYQELINLLVKMDYDGWVLLEASGEPADPIAALIQQRQLFDKMVAQAQQELTASGEASSVGVKIREEGQELGVYINGKLFTRYHFRDVPRPFFYPVIGPTGQPMTRNWPMQEAPNEEQDHPHHRSLWFTHGSVNGQDFWAELEKSGTIRHDEFTRITSGPAAGVIESKNSWVAKDGRIICTDTRTHTFYNRQQEIIMDFEVTIHATQGEVVLGDTKEGSMALRLAPTMRLKGKVAKGHIVNSEGVRDGDTWGKRAAWCDYYGPIEGEVEGAAIFDHPQNPRHPTWWHVRDYGLFAANPFGIHDFENQPAGAGDLVIPADQDLKFRYRLVFHPGDEKQGKIEKLYQEYRDSK